MADIIIEKDLKFLSKKQHSTVLLLPSYKTTDVYFSTNNMESLQQNQPQQQQPSSETLHQYYKLIPEKIKRTGVGQNVILTTTTTNILNNKNLTITNLTSSSSTLSSLLSSLSTTSSILSSSPSSVVGTSSTISNTKLLLSTISTTQIIPSELNLICDSMNNKNNNYNDNNNNNKFYSNDKIKRYPSVLDYCRLSSSTTTATTIVSNNNNNNLNKNKNNNKNYNNNNINYNKKISENTRTSSRLKLVKTLMVQTNHWQLFLAIVHLILYIVSPICLAARQDAVVNCTFPQRWEGSWFLSGYQQSIHIKGSQFSYRGKCTASDGNKYLIVDDRGCHRCLVIYEKHKNVLQYKESECEGDSMYMDQSNPAAMPMRSILKSDHRGGAHPNSNGHSRLSSSDQYIMRSNDDINDCPPDFCKSRETLQNLCDQIPGDALLYSLFRENAEPVKCPLKGPFTFTYNRGHGECKNPVSNIESCTEDSRLLLSFQACPDVQGTESTVEELTCLATWKDGNSRYLVGLVSHHHAISNEERYRCFVYEKIFISTIPGGLSNPNLKDAEYKLAQSGDATCNGLDSAEVGSRIMTLRKPPPAERCDFPIWFKGPKHWHALMGNAGYVFHSGDGSMHITKANGFMETRALCEQINHQTSTEMMAVVHYTTGCQSGFMCMMFYRRDTHIAEIQTGSPALRLEDACASDHFDINTLPFITLLASSSETQICPLEGLYNLRGAIGPPYVTSRHKRNHNNKGHNQHGHHHHEQGHRRHMTLSFRNSEEFGNTFWHSNTRGLPIRNRRAVSSSLSASDSSSSYGFVPISMPLTSSSSSSSSLKTFKNSSYDLNNKSSSSSSSSLISQNSMQSEINLNDTQRNRRDVPGCTVNYKAKRQLWVGCTEPNVIDVRPQCTDNGDEVYSCHGSWTENGTVYIIAKHAGTQHGVCISYRSLDNNAAKLVVGDACYRGLQKPPDHHLVANLTVFGKCGDTSSSNQIHNNWILICIKNGFTALFIIFFINR